MQVISEYPKPVSSAVQNPPISSSAVAYRSRPYAEQPYYVSAGHSSPPGYPHQSQQPRAVNDQIAFQVGAPPKTAVRMPSAPATSAAGDQYEWKMAGLSECSQPCGGGNTSSSSLGLSVDCSILPACCLPSVYRDARIITCD